MSSRIPENPSWRLLSKLSGWIRSWWRVDRVRVSPTEGRLLRLEPPCWLRVEGTLVEVFSRTVGETTGGPFVTYGCRSPAGPCTLSLDPRGQGRTAILRWEKDARKEELSSRQVEVFQPATE